MKRTVLISAEVDVHAPDGVTSADVVEGVLQGAVSWLTGQAQMRPVRVRVDHGPWSRVCTFTDPAAATEGKGAVAADTAG